MLRAPGCAPVLVLFLWPGVLREVDPDSGATLAETAAAKMVPQRPRATEFLVLQANKRPLLSVKYQPPQSLRLKASIDAFGVVRVRNARTYELLAESMPGEPTALRPGFNPLNRADLAPRLS